MVDLNVVLDVLQKREPHFAASSQVLALIRRGTHKGCFPAHGITTVHYVTAKYAGEAKANQTLDWLLSSFEVAPCGKKDFLHARSLGMTDFEDAVVASLALSADCAFVVTRNTDDFCRSPVPAVTPEELLAHT